MSQEILFMLLFSIWNTLMLLAVLRVHKAPKRVARAAVRQRKTTPDVAVKRTPRKSPAKSPPKSPPK